jgi:hypothetical protein
MGIWREEDIASTHLSEENSFIHTARFYFFFSSAQHHHLAHLLAASMFICGMFRRFVLALLLLVLRLRFARMVAWEESLLKNMGNLHKFSRLNRQTWMFGIAPP